MEPTQVGDNVPALAVTANEGKYFAVLTIADGESIAYAVASEEVISQETMEGLQDMIQSIAGTPEAPGGEEDKPNG